MTYIKTMCLGGTIAAAAALLMLTTGCERRELFVYQDNFKQVEVNIDWRNYFRELYINPNVTPAEDPGGMTIWFFPRDGRESYHYTVSEVRKFETYLSKGEYDGMVFDYSPSEYGLQEFVGMEYASTAKVQSTPSSYQVDSIPQLYGAEAYDYTLPRHDNGYAIIANEPEDIASDTCYMNINTGKYDKYIPYKERDTYQSTLVKQIFNMEPVIDPWDMRIRIPVKGIYNAWKMEASIAGLADGYYLVQCKASDTPCLLKLTDWEIAYPDIVENPNSNDPENQKGYIAKTFKTWGPMNLENRTWDLHKKNRGWITSDRMSNEVRINVKFTLRDRKTVVYHSFNIGNIIEVGPNDYSLSVDLRQTLPESEWPVLPYVEAYNGLAFDGVVVPWEDGANAQVGF